jgi:type II secretory pathway predicted ATPase ExeA
VAPGVAGSIPVIHPNPPLLHGPIIRVVQPPSSPSAPDEPLYESFFGLREQPFALTTDPRFLCMTASHKRAYHELLTGLRRREGLMVLTGDTGMGKTTICRAVIDALGPRTFSALILNPYMSDAEVVRVILRDFGLVSRDDIRKGAFGRADMPQLLDTLEQFLKSLVPLNTYAVVVIDEAQSLPARVLDQVRQLLAFEHDSQRLLQIILSGQPGLVQTLKTDAMRAVDGRVSRRAELTPMAPEEVDSYIQHRLFVAGSRDSVTFPPESVRAIARLTKGVPRRVNLLCDRSLEEARRAGTTVIAQELVERASHQIAGDSPLTVDDVPLGDRPLHRAASTVTPDLDSDVSLTYVASPPWWRSRWAALLAGVVVLGGLAYFGWRTTSTSAMASLPPLPSPPPRAMPRVPDPRPMPTIEDENYVMEQIRKTYGRD